MCGYLKLVSHSSILFKEYRWLQRFVIQKHGVTQGIFASPKIERSRKENSVRNDFTNSPKPLNFRQFPRRSTEISRLRANIVPQCLKAIRVLASFRILLNLLLDVP